VILGDDSATADLKIVNGSTGSLIKHVIVRGDASDFDEELGKFLRFVGGKLADIECGPPPKPKPAPKPGKGLAFSIEYAGTYIDHAADQSGAHVNDLALKWDEVLQGRVSRTGLLTFSPLKLTASGSLTTQNNVNGSSRTDQCIIGPGSVPIQHGGFINLQPQGAGSGLARFRTFQAWASIPLNVANGELAFSLGASGFCQRDDLRPFVAATASVPLPQAWQDVALAQVRGSWLKRIGQPETANFSVQSADGQIADTVSVSAQLSVATNGKIPR